MTTTYIYDLSTIFSHRNKKSFTARSMGLVIEGIFDNPEDYERPLPVGEAVELILLYTLNVPAGERLGAQAKRERFATSLKVRDCDPSTALTPKDVDTIRDAISVLPTESFGKIDQFFAAPL